MKKGIIIYGFPCVGKSTLCENDKSGKYLDLESSYYHYILTDDIKNLSIEERKGKTKQLNPNWPNNYFQAILEARKNYDYIFVAHEGIVQCKEHNIPYIIVFPDKSQKDEYISRMKNRGNSSEFIEKISQNFDNYIQNCYDDTFANKKFILPPNKYLKDIIDKLD